MNGRNDERTGVLLSALIRALAALQGKKTDLVNEEIGAAINLSGANVERVRTAKKSLESTEQVARIAAIAVKDGMFGIKWLREFLKVTGYPHPEALIAELLPDSGGGDDDDDEAAPLPWYDNLGHPPYGGAFVVRRDLLGELLRALNEAPVVALIGMGGMGKSSLAYYLATLCQEQHAGKASARVPLPGALPAVQAAIWLSDAAHPGSLTFEQLIDIIVRTLDHPGQTAAPLVEKELKVRDLLDATPALIILDNAETIVDPRVQPWLVDLPRGTRVLITSRQSTELYFQDERVRTLPLSGLTEAEARKLIREQARFQGLDQPDEAVQSALILRSGACPQAIKQLIGYARRSRQPLGVVVEHFDALTGDLLADLFGRFWDEGLLSEEARRLLVALTRFRYPVARGALVHTTAFAQTVLDAAITQLSDAALVDGADSPADQGVPRFMLHPLTRVFVQQRLDRYESFVATAEERLIAWAADYADSFGYKLSDVGVLARLEADEATLMQALAEAVTRGMHNEAVKIARGIEFFYYIKCRWDDKLTLHNHYIAAATARGDSGQQINALTMHVQLLCRLNRPTQTQTLLERLAALEAAAVGEERFHIAHARALYHHTRKEAAQAQEQWTHILERAGEWGLPGHMPIGALHWLGLSSVQARDGAMARKLFERSLELARKEGIRRWVARNQMQLALLDLDSGNLPQARRRLDESAELVDKADREQHAHLRRIEARLLRGRDPIKAQAAYVEARDLFERMGLLHELVEDDKIFFARR